MKTITLMHHTIFADLKEKALDASFDEQYPENGSFVARTIRNKVFWYYKGYTAEGDKQDKYVEPADNQEITMRVEEFRRSKVGYKERRSLVMSLKRVLPSPDPFVGDLIEALWKAGLFRLRGILIGTIAYQTYAGLLGVRLPAAVVRTDDVDFAQFHSISFLVKDTMPPALETLQSVDRSFRALPHRSDARATTVFINARKFKVEFLTPNRGSNDYMGRPAKMPALGGAAAEPLRYLDFLIYEPIDSVLLHKAGIPVTVPAPQRYAVHKLIVSNVRGKREKSRKDFEQAGFLIEALMHNSMQFDLGLAWMEAWDREPSGKIIS